MQLLKLVALAIMIAVPVSVYITTEWLQRFAYTFDLNLSLFLLTPSIIIVMAFLTIARHAMMAARTNVVDDLKRE